MNDRPEGTRRGPTPWGLIGFLVAILLIEQSLSRHEGLFSDPAATNFRYSKKVAETKSARVEILVVGTSLMKFGAVPRMIESGTGRSAFNLAVCSGHLPSSYFVLRRALENGARPKAVLLDCQDTFVQPTQEHEPFEGITVNKRNWPELLDLRDTIDLAWVARDSHFLADTLVSRVLTSYKNRFVIQDQVLNAFRGGSAASDLQNRAFVRNWRANCGVTMTLATAPPNPTRTAIVAQSPVTPTAPVPTPPKSNRLTQAYLSRLLDLASTYKFRVFWVLPPLPSEILAGREESGLDDYFTELASQVRSRSANAVVIDARRSGYPSDVFLDAVHLNAKGAIAFSAEVARIVKSELDHPSSTGPWVSLGPYRRPEAMPPFEDMERSRITVHTLEQSRRR